MARNNAVTSLVLAGSITGSGAVTSLVLPGSMAGNNAVTEPAVDLNVDATGGGVDIINKERAVLDLNVD